MKKKPSIHIYFRNDVSHAGNVGEFVQDLHRLFSQFSSEAVGSCCIMSSKDAVKVHLSVQAGVHRFEASAEATGLPALVEKLKQRVALVQV